jgi:hypothetical protein
MKHTLWQLILSITLVIHSFAAEIYFETTNVPVGTAPEGFTPWVIGSGPSGDWKVRMDSLPSAMTQISPLAVQSNRKKVITQLSTTRDRDRILMLTKDKESFEDFVMTTRVKTGQDQQTQALGIVFRWQDPKNYYSFCVDTVAGMYYFRKVVNGIQQEPLGNRSKIASNEWHSLRIECKGPKISLQLNQKESIPDINDTQFKTGKIGYWSAADTVASFGDTKIIFTPKIATAQRLVNQVMAKYSRLIQVSLYASETNSTAPTVIASNLKETIGAQADKFVLDTIARRKIYFEKTKKTAIVTLPIKDRNGESIAACRVELQKFKGQTESNAIVRAMPVVEMIQARLLDRRDLFE